MTVHDSVYDKGSATTTFMTTIPRPNASNNTSASLATSSSDSSTNIFNNLFRRKRRDEQCYEFGIESNKLFFGYLPLRYFKGSFRIIFMIFQRWIVVVFYGVCLI